MTLLMQLNRSVSWDWIECVQAGFCLLVGFTRKLWGAEVPKPNLLSIDRDAGEPNIPVFKKTHPSKAGFVVFTKAVVLLIFCMGRFAQIEQSVVCSLAVYMVNLVFRKVPMHIKPNKSVCRVFFVVDSYTPVPSVMQKTGNVPDFGVPFNANFSRENAGSRVVVKKFAQALCGKIGLSHAVVPYKQWFGQKPRRASNTAGLRHFTAIPNQGVSV
jgi:hypothetical protein